MKNSDVHCIFCNSLNVHQLLHISDIPLLDSVRLSFDGVKDNTAVERPLDIYICAECSLIQQESAKIKQYRYNYVKKDIIQTVQSCMKAHNDELTEHLAPIAPRKFVWHNHHILLIDLNGDNLLNNLLDRNANVLHIIPNNESTRYDNNKLFLKIDDFSREGALKLIQKYTNIRFNLVIRNLLQYLPDLNGFAAWLKVVMDHMGFALIEVPYIREAVRNNAIDMISHEHLYYFTLTSLYNIFSRHSLRLHNALRIPINGGSIQLRISHVPSTPSENRMSGYVHNILEEENSIGINKQLFYSDFAKRVTDLKERFLYLLKRLKKQGGKIIAYGADDRSRILIRHLGIKPTDIDYIVDDIGGSEELYLPESGIYVYNHDKLLKETPDYIVILRWYNAMEIKEKLKKFELNQTKIVIPIPQPEIIELSNESVVKIF